MRLRKIILASLLVLTSCAYFQSNLKSPEVNLNKVDVKNMTFNDAHLLFHFSIRNPNKIALNLDQVAYNLELNGRPFTNGIYDQKIQLNPESSSTVALPVKVKYSDLMQSLQDYLQDRTVKYKLDGSVKAGGLTVPFNKKGEVEINPQNF